MFFKIPTINFDVIIYINAPRIGPASGPLKGWGKYLKNYTTLQKGQTCFLFRSFNQSKGDLTVFWNEWINTIDRNYFKIFKIEKNGLFY